MAALTVSARVEGPRVVVRVIDDGPGIPEELKRRIFDPFFSTKPVGQGTGTGLDIARGFVQSNDGRLDFDSVPGKTEFRVALPIALAVRARRPKPSPWSRGYDESLISS